jgi:hypothetical protein
MIMDMDVVVGLRGAGKTYRLIEWLTEGHEIPGHPKWSRMIIAAALDPKHYGHQAPSELTRKLWQAYPPGLSRLVISAKDFQNHRGGFPGVEFAVDDAEYLLPEWLSMLAGRGQLAGLTISGRSGSTIGRPGVAELEVAEGGSLFTDNKISFRRSPTARGQFPV